ncbi:hypothetical protein OS187_09920 [Xanthomonadaceae bacterium JHOS43]|nr:hypothetical protein [Xanthomonadaceae bacterium JHOS43]MCX7564100.1 hypothetical protein [Xanthomonadaceae bacterium XH05]
MSKQPKVVQETNATADPVETAAAAVGHLYEAKERLKDAAVAAGDAVRSAASTAVKAARDDLKSGKEAIADPLHDAASASRAAASEAKAAAGAEFDVLMDKGKELWSSAEGVIRQHPVAAFGAALAAGWLIARLVRRG